MSDDAWRKRIETLMEERNISRTEMARRMGRNHTIMKAVLDENRIPRMDTAILIARALGVSLAYLFEGDVASPVVVAVDGRTGGKGMWSEYAPGEALSVPLRLFEENSVSVHIENDEYEPRFHRGDVIVGAKHFGNNLDNLIGTECIIKATDGTQHIRILLRGSVPGRFNLRSFDVRESDVANARLEWAAPVGLIIRSQH